MKALEDKAVAAAADMADASADGGAAATAEGCPPRLIGGGAKQNPKSEGCGKNRKPRIQIRIFQPFCIGRQRQIYRNTVKAWQG